MFVPSVSWQNDHFYTKSGQKVPFSHVVDEVADLLWLEEMIQRELSDVHTDGIRDNGLIAGALTLLLSSAATWQWHMLRLYNRRAPDLLPCGRKDDSPLPAHAQSKIGPAHPRQCYLSVGAHNNASESDGISFERHDFAGCSLLAHRTSAGCS
jgi:hypothetical protein